MACPVRHRRAIDHDRAGNVWPRCGKQHHRPASLAIADQHGFGACRMTLGHHAHEFDLRIHDVGHGLARLGIRKEDDEIDRMSRAKRDTHFGIGLEPANARTMPRTRVDDDEWTQRVVDLDAGRRNDANERVVDRPPESAAVRKYLVFVCEQRWLAGALVLDVIISALTQRVPKQRGALNEVERVRASLLP